MDQSHDFRQYFQIPSDIINLNNGTMSHTPLAVQKAEDLYRKSYESQPAWGLFYSRQKLWDLQKKVANFLNARPFDLIFRTNITYALNEIILGLKTQPNTEFLTTDLEYGAIVNQVIAKCEQANLQHRVIHLPSLPSETENLDEEKLIEKITQQLTPKTRYLLISHITTSTGLVIPIEKLSKITRQKGIILIVDGAHASGILPLDMSTFENIEFYTANFHKWMMGPKVAAFAWVNPRARELLSPTQFGWTTRQVPEHFQAFGEGDKFTQAFMLSSSIDFSPFYALSDMIDFWNTHGFDNIQRARKQKAQLLKSEMTRTGWTPMYLNNESLQGPLYTYDVPRQWQSGFWSKAEHLYKKHHLVLSYSIVKGVPRIRLSPNIYTNDEEIIKAVDILKNCQFE